MSWKFRKRVKVMPGVYLNFSRSGVSTTIGPRGASINIGTHGTYLNTGIPGTGLYNRTSIGGKGSEYSQDEIANKLNYLLTQTYDGSEQIKSETVEELTSSGMQALKQTIITAHKEYQDITKLLDERAGTKAYVDKRLLKSRKSIFSFLQKKKIARLDSQSVELAAELSELQEQQSLASVDLKVENDETFSSLYRNVEKAYLLISSCQKIWDITTTKDINRAQTRSAADTEVRRVEVGAMLEHSGLIHSERPPLKLLNKNGGDLFFYPGFVIIHEQAMDFAILDYSEFTLEFRTSQFLEEETIPSDTKAIGTTWAKVNKDGSRDKRFSGNYQIPIVQYAQITFSSPTGVNERYLFSNHDYAELFYKALNEYISAIKSANSLLNEFR